MSAIGGIVHFDGAPVVRSDLERMSHAMEAFGRDGQRISLVQSVGFVVRTTHITPEDILDTQPVRLSGNDTLVFDGRIDNRADILRSLGLSESEGRRSSDSALVGRAWERFGRECLGQLVGDFGVAHWSASTRRLILARSSPRGKPLYYTRQGERLYFSSTPHGLFALPQVPREINESALGDLLLLNSGTGGTLYRGVEIVRNASWTEHRIDGSTASYQYWAPDPAKRLHFKRDEEVWEAFQALFEDVVRSHLRSIHPVGVQMSGGLDSAAVAGQAARILSHSGKTLHGYTRVPAPGGNYRPDGNAYNDERPRVEAIARMHSNLQPHFVHAGEEPLLDGLTAGFQASYWTIPIQPSFVTGYQPLYRRAQADGMRVLLFGASGNVTISYDGHARLASLFMRGRWFELARELQALQRFDVTAGDEARGLLIDRVVPQVLRRVLRYLRGRPTVTQETFTAANREFAHSTGAMARRFQPQTGLRNRARLRGGWNWRVQTLTQTGLGGADAKQAVYGLDMRDPTGDRRIAEFCLALPNSVYLKGGLDRRLVRMGLANLIPEEVRSNAQFGRQDVDWVHRTRRDMVAISNALQKLECDPGVARYLNVAEMRALWDRFDQVDWMHASLDEQMRYSKCLMGGLAVGQFLQWFEQEN